MRHFCSTKNESLKFQGCQPLPNAPGAVWGWTLALVPCPAPLRLVRSHLTALPCSYLPPVLSNYLCAWGGKEKGKAEMDLWEESCKQRMHGGEEEGVRRQSMGVMEGISEELEYCRGVKRARRNMVDESSEDKWEKLSSWASQTSQPTSIPHRALFQVSCLLYMLPSHLSSPSFKVFSVAPGYWSCPSPAPPLRLHAGTCKHRRIMEKEAACNTVNKMQCRELGSGQGKGSFFGGGRGCVWV